MKCLLWCLLVPSLALGAPRGSLEVGMTVAGQTLIGEAQGGENVYDFVESDAGYGVALGVEWGLGPTVHLGGELWLGLLPVATGGLKRNGYQVQAHLGPRLRVGFPLGGDLTVEGLIGLAPGYITAPIKGSASLTTRVGIGLAYGIHDETAIVLGANHMAVAAWPAEALVDDIRVTEPLFVGLSAVLFTVGVRGLR